MKSYADKRRNTKPPKLYVGNCVLVKQYQENKLTTPFDQCPYEATTMKVIWFHPNGRISRLQETLLSLNQS